MARFRGFTVIVPTQEEIDIRGQLRSEILALKRSDFELRKSHELQLAELKRQLDNAITFARLKQTENETLTEQIREAKAAIGNGSV
jgi:hypothetical protein